MKIVILGSGTIACIRAATLLSDARVTWLGIGSSRREWAENAAARVEATSAGTADEMLSAAPDAVVVSSASANHAGQITACLPLSVPIFCEKPIATTIGDAQRVVRLAHRAGTQIQVGFQRHFDHDLIKLRSDIQAGSLGAIYSITFACHDRTPPPEAFASQSGGMFMDLQVHDFDLARWLSGEEVDQVFAVAATRGPAQYLAALGDVDTAAVLLRMRSGLPVLVRGSRQDPKGFMMRTEVVASERSLSIGDERHRDYAERFRDALAAEMHAFVDLVAGDRENPCPGHECVEAMRIAAAARLSHKERRVVLLDEMEDTGNGTTS